MEYGVAGMGDRSEYMNQKLQKDLARKAEAFLFIEGGSLAKKKLAKLLKCSDAALQPVLAALKEDLGERGIALIESDEEVALAVSSHAAAAVKEELERELAREVGDAGLEVLAILLYRGPSTRAQIDYIRGVNTSTTLRTLLARGLALRIENPNDAREYLYSPTAELLAYLGVRSKHELPDYEKISAELSAFEQKSAEDDHHA